MGIGTSSGVTYEALSLQNNLYMNSTVYKIYMTKLIEILQKAVL